jgi:DNA (cytosine-5)-methyltransferase 1
VHYYNDIDANSCAWLEELIRRGLLPAGVVDNRSILDVMPADLTDFAQCHFFAGIGGWPYALRLAGVPEDWPVWTGSPPCQPFSAAGQQKGQDDERHLAPHFAKLVAACRPALIFGEQVASAAVFGKIAGRAGGGADAPAEWAWIDDLSDRLEAAHYAVGASDIPAAGVGAPHIRQRTFFGAVSLRLGDTDGRGWTPWREGSEADGHRDTLEPVRGAIGMADADVGRQSRSRVLGRPSDPATEEARQVDRAVDARGRGGLADGALDGWSEERAQPAGVSVRDSAEGRRAGPGTSGSNMRTRPLDDPWRDADWLFCRDGKWRPVEPGALPLASRVSARVGRLRGYGNAIVPQAAALFIEATLEAVDMTRLNSGYNAEFSTEYAPPYEVLTTPDELERVLDIVGDGVAALDFEGWQIVRLAQIRSDDVWAVIDFGEAGANWFGEVAHWFEDAAWIVFNSGHEKRYFEKHGAAPTCWDVGNLRRALRGGGHMSLKQLVGWELEVELDKTEQASDWDRGELSRSQLDYAADDAHWTWQVWKKLRAEADDGHMRCFDMLDGMADAVIEMEETGLTLDPVHHQQLVDHWQELNDEREVQIRELITEGEVENLNSGKQLNDFFAQIMPDDILEDWPKTEKTGLLSTKNKDLLNMAGVFGGTPLGDALRLLAERSTLQKYLSSFGQTLINKARMNNELRVHARYNIGAAITCRFSSCLPEYVQVTFPDGSLVPMSDILPGDLVLTHRGRARKVISNTFSGIEKTYRIYLSSGHTLDCTTNHRLLTDAGWLSLEDMGYDCEDTGSDHARHGRRLLRGGQADHEGAGHQVSGQREDRTSSSAQVPVGGYTQSRGGAAVLEDEARGVKPYEREVRGAAPQLCRGGTRSQGVPDDREAALHDAGYVEAGVSTPRGHVRSAGSERVTGRVSRPPHQRGQDGQSTGKSLPRVCVWSRSVAPQYAEIRRVDLVGTLPVFDLEIEEDASFVANGVVVHNSSPNLQQIPRDREFFGERLSVRKSFVAAPDNLLVSLDYSGIEMRVLALVSGDEQLLEDVVHGDPHAVMAEYVVGRPIDKTVKEDKDLRQSMKAVNFGIVYGTTALGLAGRQGWSYSYAEDLLNYWSQRYPKAWEMRFESQKLARQKPHLIRMVDGGTIYMGPKPGLTRCANYPVQRAALSVMAHAIIRHKNSLDDFRDRYPRNFVRMASTIHDALIDEAAEAIASAILQLMYRDMVDGYLDVFPGAPIDKLVEGGLGPNWGELEEIPLAG